MTSPDSNPCTSDLTEDAQVNVLRQLIGFIANRTERNDAVDRNERWAYDLLDLIDARLRRADSNPCTRLQAPADVPAGSGAAVSELLGPDAPAAPTNNEVDRIIAELERILDRMLG